MQDTKPHKRTNNGLVDKTWPEGSSPVGLQACNGAGSSWAVGSREHQ
jgi:hypothetical protein